VLHEHSTACAERQALHVLGLRQIAGHDVLGLLIRHAEVSEGQTADLAGRGDVTLEQDRGDAERARYVVEAEARIIDR
jgi:hypothetical protein